MKKDDLTKGHMALHFRTLAIPAAFGMLFSTLYNVVDVYYAGILSTDAQAGLAIGYQAFFILMAIGFGLSSALSSLVSNAKGSGDDTVAQRYVAQGIAFGVIITGSCMVIGWFLGPRLIDLVSEPGAYRDAALGYFYWLIFALPGFLLAYGGNGILQAHGDSRSMQRALMLAFVANIALNPLFMFGLPGLWNGMGFNGIAAATIISQTGVMVYIVKRIFQLDIMQSVKFAAFSPDKDSFKNIFAQLLPASSAMMVMFISGFVVQFALKSFGGHAVAAYGVAIRIEQILLLPILGMTGALLPIAGQNFGAQKFDRVRSALKYCWGIGFAMTALAMPILLFGGSFAMALFSNDPDVIRAGSSYLRVDAFLFPIYMMLFSINSLLQSFKQAIWTLWISVYRQGFAVGFFVWMFINFLDFGVQGVWFGIATAVTSGWVMSLIIVSNVAKTQMGGLLLTPLVKPSQ
ncbi:MAG: MATE family efflux transporter [Kordiimonadaceae bacterium]|jgi:putative MATE family efflux protein|nr:MATE family efflux transporter [Kordiimonadaceae bacterium]MBT7544283.1 MATE family efflux transporter [Kordiimonadaceae bacterium]MBT7605266.1 MATE family efflux transporter [Kordiimonadaceae bacterium]